MKELMRKAHQLTKEIKREYPEVDYKFQLGLCMKYLLNEKKEGENKMVELKGTEKQINWANKIRMDLLEKCDDEEVKEYLKSIIFAQIFIELRYLKTNVKRTSNERKNEELKKYVIVLIKEAIQNFVRSKVKRNNVNQLFPDSEDAFLVFDINTNYTLEKCIDVMKKVEKAIY